MSLREERKVTWAVVATTCEPRRSVEQFIAHHLALGAGQIILFFDEPSDATALILEKIPGLVAIRCDSEYWSQRGKGRPDSARQRDVWNANYGAAIAATDWIMHLQVGDFLAVDPSLETVASALADAQTSAISATILKIGKQQQRAMICRADSNLRFSQGRVKGLDENNAMKPSLWLEIGRTPDHGQLQKAVEKFVASFRRPDSAFSHISATRDKIRKPRKVFQIGMNRCGSKEICLHFSLRGFSYAHWANGRLAKELLVSKSSDVAPFSGFEEYELLSDIEINGDKLSYEGFYDFEYIARYFTDAVFILNYRPVSDWLLSRSSFRGGKYIEAHRRFFDLPSHDAVRQKWECDWNDHLARVEAARLNGLKILDWPIYTMRPVDFFQNFAKV